MKKLIYALILCTGIIMCGCSSDATDESTTGNIAGSVSDRTTGEPGSTVNVKLSTGGKSTVT